MFFMNSRDQWQIFVFDKVEFVKQLSFQSKTYRAVFRTQSNIYKKAFLWFLQRCPTVDVSLGSKYATAYIYIQVSPIEIILQMILRILNIFAVKYLFVTKENWNKVAISKLREIS